MADSPPPDPVAGSSSLIDVNLDDLFQSMSLGSVEKAIAHNLIGINHRQMPGMVPINKDVYGLTFFVRPQLNLQSENIRNDRLLHSLMTNQPFSVQRYVRCMLDPRLIYGYGSEIKLRQPMHCPLVDNRHAFISILTNNINSVSGWPDSVLQTYDSNRGIYNEVYSQVDSIAKNYEAYDLDVSFRNTRGDPIVYLFYIWHHYMALVFEGRLVPYPDFIVENEIDYMTRIYRLVLDPSKRYVTKIASTGVSFPLTVPMGSFFDYSTERPFNDQNKDITIRFRALGACYQDDISVYEFNRTVTIFNPDMVDVALHRSRPVGRGLELVTAKSMTRIPQDLLQQFNNYGYPWINPNNYELEWWIPTQEFTARLQGFKTQQLLPNTQYQTTNTHTTTRPTGVRNA